MTHLRLGTRGSRLAVTQSEQVAQRLRERSPDLSVELVEIRTSGDVIRDVPLGPHLGRSFFTKEIEVALLDGRIDVAVHSCKDLATAMTPGLLLAAVPVREDARDALVSAAGRLSELPAGARVGTSSPRRKGFLAVARPDVHAQDQRGNVPTRLRAVEDGSVDAVILALAGLRRLGLSDRVVETLDPSVMLPAAGQGALAVQIRAGDVPTRNAVEWLDDPESRARVTAERACLHALEAGCHAPVGALARMNGQRLHLAAAVVAPDGVVRAEEAESLAHVGSSAERLRAAEAVGVAAARSLLAKLGLSSLAATAWAGPAPERLARRGAERA
jgi:hydroxymethylbilane synthase